MMQDTVPNTGAEPQPGIHVEQPSELCIHVAFHSLPIISEPTDGKDIAAVQYGPPFLRFPMNLSAKDAVVLESLFDTGSIALVGFEIKHGNGRASAYTTVMPRY